MFRKMLVLLLFISVTRLFALENDIRFLLETLQLPADYNFMPSISNGHLGLTAFGDSIYVNGVYNGYKGNSRRARLPNWLNITAKILGVDSHVPIKYSMNLFDGYFQWTTHWELNDLKLQQRVYAHRFYNRALIYELKLERSKLDVPFTVELTSNAGSKTQAFDIVPEMTNESNIIMVQATTKEVEHKHFQPNRTRLFVAFSDSLHEGSKRLELKAGEAILEYRFVITADLAKNVALAEMNDVLSRRPEEVFEKHVSCWNDFWQQFRINVEGNTELAQIINAGIFYLASSLPSFESNRGNNPYFGLSPTGLSRGQLDADYEGHNFWDTEIWMLPVVTQMHTFWSEELFNYRLSHIHGAKYNANQSGYHGARFPWESAFTGTEVTNPCCPEVATQEIHISADIAVALQQFYATTHDRDWLCRAAWPLVREIATYLSSRSEWNNQTNKYHIRNVMGPDEDHENVDDNVYTNVASKQSFEFASFARSQCAPNSTGLDWEEISNKMFILYDAVKDFHPQHVNYQPGEEIKQADTILLGYPLQYDLANSTRCNDLSMYENVTRESGPAMTWSMFAINYLDIGNKIKADHYFIKGYREYVRPEFKVWSETKIGFEGSANFLTGIGGFLQSIINGYAGIRFRFYNTTTKMLIRSPSTLPGTKQLTIKGIKFANSTFLLSITEGRMNTFKCLHLGHKPLFIVVENRTNSQIFPGFEIQFKAEMLTIYTN